MPLNLSIDEETMRALIGDAILASIDVDGRNALIQAAINYLVSPRKRPDSWRNEVYPSPLEEAFIQAVEVYARTVVREYIETDPQVGETLRAKLGELFGGYRHKLDEDGSFSRELNAWVIAYLSGAHDV
ncbi:MAG TPA: hypothetical protein VM367_03575 [Pseudonocardia sp.]|nr:hypothetical protein [Pseudonocardia sp.]